MKPPAPEPEPKYETRILSGEVDPRIAGMLVIDAEGAGRADLLVWSAKGITLYRNGGDPVRDSGPGELSGVVSVTAGDFDNDGFADLCIVTDKGPQLWRNRRGRFERVPANLPAERFEKAIWIDYDHDYDLDLVLLGENSRPCRNQGAAGFVDRTAAFPFQRGHAIDAIVTRVRGQQGDGFFPTPIIPAWSTSTVCPVRTSRFLVGGAGFEPATFWV
jgi:FG-GAP-like repeat